MTVLKNFKQYTPQDADSLALIQEIGALFLQSEEGVDWYQAQQSFDPNLLKVVFDGVTGVIISVSKDVHTLWPINACVADVDYLTNTDLEVEDLQDKIFDIASGKIVDRIFSDEELKAKVDAKVSALQKQVSEIITPLTYAADLEIITKDEAAYLKALKIYSVNLSRIPSQEGYPQQVIYPTLP